MKNERIPSSNYMSEMATTIMHVSDKQTGWEQKNKKIKLVFELKFKNKSNCIIV